MTFVKTRLFVRRGRISHFNVFERRALEERSLLLHDGDERRDVALIQRHSVLGEGRGTEWSDREWMCASEVPVRDRRGRSGRIAYERASAPPKLSQSLAGTPVQGAGKRCFFPPPSGQ